MTDPMQEDWYDNTRASAHMTGDPGKLQDSQIYDGHDKVMIGDGKLLSIYLSYRRSVNIVQTF